MTDPQFITWLKTADSIRCVLVEVVARIGGTETTLYLSSMDYTTSSSDTPASVSYAACIKSAGTTQESLSLDGTFSISYGDLEIDNRGGIRDSWLGYVWANRSVKVYLGDPRWIRSDFRLMFAGMVADMDMRDAEVLNLKMQDKLLWLNSPLTEATLGGTSNNKDRLIPVCFGECFNVTPLMTNSATLEYQVHNGAMEGIIEVRSNGAVPVTNTPTVGTGKFTLGASPAGTTITVSVQGDKPGGTYNNTIVPIVKQLVKNWGPSAKRFVDADLDLTSLAAFDAAHPQPVGLYAADRMTVLDACQQLARSVGAAVVMTTQGLLRLVQLAIPTPGTGTAVTGDDMEYHTLTITNRPAVKSTCRLGYAQNYTPQPTGLATGVPPQAAALYKEQWLTKTSTDATVQSVYATDAMPPIEETCLLVEADASTEADRRRDLWKVPRSVYTATYFPWLMLTELGDPITITHARFGLSAGTTGIVVEIQRDWLKGRISIGVLA